MQQAVLSQAQTRIAELEERARQAPASGAHSSFLSGADGG
jgi:hypothetical protein